MYISELYISAIFSHCCPHKQSELHTHSYSLTSPLSFSLHTHTHSRDTIEIVVEELDYINEERDRGGPTQTEEGEKSLPQQGTVCACINNSSIYDHHYLSANPIINMLHTQSLMA